MMKDGLERALQCARILEDNADETDSTITWSGKQYNVTKGSSSVDITLENGLAGICIFFLELFSVTKSPRHKEIVIKCALVLRQKVDIEMPYDYGLYTGRMGIAWVFLKIFKLLHHKKYLSWAKEVVENCKPFVLSPYVNNSIFNGRSGVLLGIAAVCKTSPDPHLQDLLNIVTKELLKDGTYLPNGIEWQFSETQTGPVNSFGFGNAGIGYAFYQLGEVTGSREMLLISSEVFKTVRASFDRTIHGWSDNIQVTRNSKTSKNAFTADRDFVKLASAEGRHSFINGSLGILHSYYCAHSRSGGRISWPRTISAGRVLNDALKFLRTPQDFSGFYWFLAKIKQGRPFSLKQSEWRRYHNKLLSLECKVDDHCFGLCNGLAGLGYYYLIFSGGVKSPYFLFENDHDNGPFSGMIDLATVRSIPIFKNYPRSAQYLLEKDPTDLNQYLYKNDNSWICGFDRYLSGYAKGNVDINLYYSIERRVYNMIKKRPCPAEIHKFQHQSFSANRRLQRLGRKKIMGLSYSLSNYVKIVRRPGRTHGAAGSAGQHLILSYIGTQKNIRVLKLSGLQELLVNFRRPVKGDQVVNAIVKRLGPPRGESSIKSRLLGLILVSVGSGILQVHWPRHKR